MSYEFPSYAYWSILDYARMLWIYFYCSTASLEVGNLICTPLGTVTVMVLLPSIDSDETGVSPAKRAFVRSSDAETLVLLNFNETPIVRSQATLVLNTPGFGFVFATPFRSPSHFIESQDIFSQSTVRLFHRPASHRFLDESYARAIVSNIRLSVRLHAIHRFVKTLVPPTENDMSYEVLTAFSAHIGIFLWPRSRLPESDWMGWRQFPWGRVRMQAHEGGTVMPETGIVWYVVEDMQLEGMSWPVQHGVLGVPRSLRASMREEGRMPTRPEIIFTQEVVEDVEYVLNHGEFIRDSWIQPRYGPERIWEW